MNLPPLRRLLSALLAVCLLLGFGSASAAITLTIDPTLKTFTWSGSGGATWNGAFNSLILGTGDAFDGISTGTGSGSVSAFALDSLNTSRGELRVGTSYVDTFIGVDFVSGTENYTVIGDGTSYSYATLSAGRQAVLESTNGQALYLFNTKGNFSSSVGTVEVIAGAAPEPSRMVLALGGLSALSLRRRRKA